MYCLSAVIIISIYSIFEYFHPLFHAIISNNNTSCKVLWPCRGEEGCLQQREEYPQERVTLEFDLEEWLMVWGRLCEEESSWRNKWSMFRIQGMTQKEGLCDENLGWKMSGDDGRDGSCNTRPNDVVQSPLVSCWCGSDTILAFRKAHWCSVLDLGIKLF